jgi:predicted ATPase
MGEIIDEISIRGFKSIRELNKFKLNQINVLIGSNGVGKSNFVGFFRLLRQIIDQRLKLTLATDGGASTCLYLGPKVTKELWTNIQFGQNGYEFSLTPTVLNELVFASEYALYKGPFVSKETRRSLGSGHSEANLKNMKNNPGFRTEKGSTFYVYDAVSSWVVYHFHDTSSLAGVRIPGQINDNEILRPSAENLAAFLFRIQQTHPESYNKIRAVVRLAAPFFDDFRLRPIPASPDKIQLEWLQIGSDYPFLASQLSDGTLRFICLATALLQPGLPRTILFDEPELGLHPYALTLLGSLFHKAVAPNPWIKNQIIVSTQSALLLDEFVPEDIVVVERSEGQSVFRRLAPDHLSDWLSDYTLGELWQKNILGGRSGVDLPGEPHAARGLTI